VHIFRLYLIQEGKPLILSLLLLLSLFWKAIGLYIVVWLIVSSPGALLGGMSKRGKAFWFRGWDANPGLRRSIRSYLLVVVPDDNVRS
jgi:hypothetical protein